MPWVFVEAYEGRTLEQKRKLVKAITEAVSECYQVAPEHVSVQLRDVSREDWASGGVLACDRK